MNKEIKSFQENIQKTFILHSLAPVIAITSLAMVIFIATWTTSFRSSTKTENSKAAQEIEQSYATYCTMISEVQDVIDEADVFHLHSNIYECLYANTQEADSIGDLILLSPKLDVIFSNNGNNYRFLKSREYMQWGVLGDANRHPNETRTVLYDGKMCMVKGVFSGDVLRYYIVYVVPKEEISSYINIEGKMMYITDATGWIFASNTKKLTDSYGQISDRLEHHNGMLRIQGHRYFGACRTLSFGWQIYTVEDIDYSLRIIEMVIFLLVIIFIGIIIISYRNAKKSSLVYTQDVIAIEDAFESVQQGNLEVSLDIDSSKEFQTIGHDFNDMLAGLKTQIEENRELAEHVAFSQVKRLESQFNPHFLFNTLDNIRFMAKIDSAAADKMIVSLSGLLRYSLRETREEVTLEEDLKYLQFYLNILQIRFNKRFAYEIDVSNDILHCLIPKLILQPMLENAIKYGFGDHEKLTVHIQGYNEENRLVFVCKDDGIGMTDALLAELKQQLDSEENISTHLGLYNIHRRIRLMYGADYGLQVHSTKNQGTEVIIILPIQEEGI